MITQGKWEVGKWENGTYYITVGSDSGVLCTLNDLCGFPAEANARLIAAAPDLLEALQEIQDSFANCHLPREVCVFKVAKQAIAKADI